VKILLTVDPEIPVPPIHYGGIERIVDGLAGEYARQGHKVVLVAHPDSACVVSRLYSWEGGSSVGWRNICTNAFQLAQIYRNEKPDIVHSFSRLLYLYPLFAGARATIVQSYQRKVSPHSTRLASIFGGCRLRFTACAAHLFKSLPNQQKWSAIYNFTDTNYFTPDPSSVKEYLLFLGRIQDIKGAREAIDVALKTGERIIIAGNVPVEHQNYFQEKVQPLIDDKQVIYVGPVNDEAKRTLLRNAKAFLFPIKWEEPFGIVLAESLACGAPVLAFNRGSVPEVIADGCNGFVCDTVEGMADKVRQIHQIDRISCRASASERFSAEVIARQYLSLFKRTLS